MNKLVRYLGLSHETLPSFWTVIAVWILVAGIFVFIANAVAMGWN